MKHYSVRQLTLAAVIGALYAVLTLTASVFGITYGPVQCRVSEALCVLPFFFPEAKWGLFVGCLIANLLSPYGAPDIICGSLATLLAACITAKLPAKWKWFAPLPPVLSNALMIGALLGWYSAGFGPAFPAAFAFNADGGVGRTDRLLRIRRRTADRAAKNPLLPPNASGRQGITAAQCAA